jgi:peptidoglycan/xylan/chitin deacetylase (PgdA/CDA1 family)
MEERFSVCLSHDVDRIKKTFQYGTHFLKSIAKGDLGSAIYQVKSVFQDSHYWNFQKIMALEKELGLRSTFFFLNETYPFHPLKMKSWRLSLGYYNLFEPDLQAAIKELDKQGWEIALHGSFLSFKDLNLLKKEKADLESITGRPVVGVRQHYLNLDPFTWERQAKAGFLYDASFGRTDDIGFKDNKFHIFKALADKHFWVVPLALMDSCVMNKKDPFQEAMEVVEMAEKKNACLVFNWHQRVFNTQEFPGYLDMYLRLIEECKRRDAQFLTIKEYVVAIMQDRPKLFAGGDPPILV